MTKLQSWTMMGISSVVLVIGVLLVTGALTSAQSPTPTPSATGGASGGTFKSNEDPAHEAGESAEQEAQENAGIRPGGGMRGGCAGGHGLIQTAAAEVLGLSTEDLRTQIQSGKSLAEVAQAHGMSVDNFKTALVAKATADLKTKLDAGTITQAQYDSITANLQANVDAIVNEHHTAPTQSPGGGTRFHRPFGNAAPGSGA